LLNFLFALFAGLLRAQLGDLNLANADPREDSSRGRGWFARQFRSDGEEALPSRDLPELRRDIPDAGAGVNRVALIFRQSEADLADACGGFDLAGDIDDLNFANAMFDSTTDI
jgi:hypothetical protein